ncbi:hypothetical protein [Streptomyces sp. NPDC030920]|uniref:hypothetical protein n=1 Tax=Streptomyces sp. NPDC030920 TaxID=3365308 RepID=UPI00384BCEB3
MSIMTREPLTPTHVGGTGLAFAPRAGKIDEVGREVGREDDRSGHNGSGYERDETDQFHQFVRDLVADGDEIARSAGRQARRTFAEMAPGQTRQPVLRMTRQLTFTPTAPRAGADEACLLCGYWKCRCGIGLVALTDAEREELSRKNAEQNKRSESNRR